MKNDNSAINFVYDFWYQVCHNVMVSNEQDAPYTLIPELNLDYV